MNYSVLLPLVLLASLKSMDLLPYPFEFRVTHSEPFIDVSWRTLFDVPMDSSSDPLIARANPDGSRMSQYRTNVYFDESTGKTAFQRNFDWYVTEVKAVNVDNDYGNEIAVAYNGDSLVGVRIFDDGVDGDTLSEYVMLEKDFRWRTRADKWDPYIEFGPMISPAGCEHPCLILNCGSGYCRMPRGMLAINPLTGKEIWHRWVGGGAEDWLLSANTNGDTLLIIGTSSSGNGAEVDSTNDSECYIYALEPATGNLIWMRRFAGMFSRAIPRLRLRSDGVTEEIVAVYTSSARAADPAKIMIMDPVTGDTRREASLPPGMLCIGLELTRNERGQWGAYVCTAKDGLFEFDSTLVIARQRKDIANVLWVGEADGMRALLANRHRGDVVLLNGQFGTIGKIEYNGQSMTVQHYQNLNWPVFWLTDSKTVARVEISENDHYATEVIARVTLPIIFVAGLTWGARSVVRTRRVAKRNQQEKERLAAWAALASKIAHDIRTPVGAIKLSAQNLETELEQIHGETPEKLQPYIAAMMAATQRAEIKAQSLLKFVRLAPPLLSSVRLDDLIHDTVERHPHSPAISVDVHCSSGLPNAWVDRDQIVDLLENLISNSLKAMKHAGRLSVNLRLERVLHTAKNWHDVFQLSVSDTGHGIPSENLSRIFDPYYTLSEGGTGLGLVIVKRIVEDHEGTIEVQSQVGIGTTFIIELPVERNEQHG
jgi:signal transduction histidine kinase